MLKKRVVIISWILVMACILMDPMPASAQTYYTMREVGISGFPGTPHYEIRSWNGNTITYRVMDTSNGSDYPVIGKWKKAKVNGKTKYYAGNLERYDQTQMICYELFGTSFYPDVVDYLKKSTKSKCKKYLRKKNPRVDMVIKKGKIKVLVYNAQVAG